MKLKHLHLFLLFFGFCAMVYAQKKPYNNFIITEVRSYPDCFFEFTNMGNETIDLSEFKLCSMTAWQVPWPSNTDSYVFPKVMLAPGKSFVLASAYDAEPRRWLLDPKNNRQVVTQPEMYKLADRMIHMAEPGTPAVKDSITPHYGVMYSWIWFLKHIYTIDGVKDSMIIDQVEGVFDEADGTNYETAYDVAGVKEGTSTCMLMRKASVTTGVTEFTDHASNDAAAAMQFRNNRGIDLSDSEWIPVPYNGGKFGQSTRAVFWTVGNQGDYKLDANTLVPKTPGKIQVDLDKATITVPWGIRYNDSIMYQFVRKPGLAWRYDYAPTTEDSMYTSIRNGDKLTLYVCGNEATIKTFSFIVLDPTPSDNIVIPKAGFDYTKMVANRNWKWFEVSDGVRGMDTISGINFATRIDTLYKYLEKAPKASWKIVSKDGIDRPDLRNGDKLVVTSENGNVKEYFLKLTKYVPNQSAKLSSITWPDMPSSFKGDLARFYGWKGDTIPGFDSGNNSYILKIPALYDGIPALQFTKEDLNSKVEVNRAKTLEGSLDEATATYTVTAEDGITRTVYTVRFDKEKSAENTQPFIAEPFISQYQTADRWLFSWLEIVNPGNQPLDLSHYILMAATYGNIPTMFKRYNFTYDTNRIYMKYVPGKKWDEANWAVRPRMLLPDLGTNGIVAPGDVFVMTGLDLSKDADSYPGEVHWFQDEIDFNFSNTPWGGNYGINNLAIDNQEVCLFKILNDSVIDGLKPATDFNDFKLIDVLGNGDYEKRWVIGGVGGRVVTGITGLTRKPNVWKGNPEFNGSFGTTPESSEWIVAQYEDMRAKGYTSDRDIKWHQLDGMGSHVMDPVAVYKSTVTSSIYKVSPGYSDNETIRGLTTGTTVTGFYNNIMKADSLQTLKVKSGTNGNELAEASLINNGDILVVLSADSVNTSKYTLSVTANGLSSDALLTSTQYTIQVNGATGTVSGFSKNTPLKTVFAGVNVPAGASLTITDQNDAYMSLSKLNYDSAYVDVIATDKTYFEVIAENGTTKIVYQLKPATSPSDAYITSDIYSVDQNASLIQFIPDGTNVSNLLNNIVPASGATMFVSDKAGYKREMGQIYRDDKLVVTSADGSAIKVYYFAMLNFKVNKYLAYVISDTYSIDQVKQLISGPFVGTSISEFKAKLSPSFGATIKVMGNKGAGSENTGNLATGDVLVVTAADGVTTATYMIDKVTGISEKAMPSSLIKMYPNPTLDKVIVQGLAKGNRVQVFNAAGVTLRDVIVDNSTEYVSLAYQPAGIYVFVISNGDQHISIQKIIKK